MITTDTLVLRNGAQTATFVRTADGFRPEWFRLDARPMLRFKDHEWLNVSAMRVTAGTLVSASETAAEFGGTLDFAGTAVAWSVRVAVPADGGSGFTVTTRLIPVSEPIEILEGMSTFELPYEYGDDLRSQVVMGQQPVYRYEDGEAKNGAGYMHPHWYYGRPGRAHLTYPCSSPLFTHRMADADGGNARYTMILGQWDATSVKDMFAQPTRALKADEAIPFPDPALKTAPGKCGMKFLIGAVNWNNSLYKDPNVLVETTGLSQQLTVDFADTLVGGTWDTWLAAGWERLALAHFPADGCVPAYEVARSRGASWTEGAAWLADTFTLPGGRPGFFNPERGPAVYTPGTRPKWDNGVELFAGQYTGPVAYLGHVYGDDAYRAAAARLEPIFRNGGDPVAQGRNIWTIGNTPFYVAVLRKAALCGVDPATLAHVRTYVATRADYTLNPPEGAKRGDAGILAWDAFANLLAAEQFDTAACEATARELLARVNAKLDGEFWTFNCAQEGNLVGAGQARPFGHGMAMSANVLAWKRFGDPAYLDAARRFGNLLLAMHYITFNESPSPDLDTRGWCLGSTGGRDQWAQLPPWETEFALQQFAYLMQAEPARAGIYDVLWLHAHTGLAQFPKARTMKRLYTPDMGITYRQIDSLPSERAFYLSLPYAGYENPWDQTMLAGYQSCEPIIMSLFVGGGLAAADDDRVLVTVPAAATYDPSVATSFTAELWNPLATPITTRLRATQAVRRGVPMAVSGAVSGTVTPDAPCTDTLTVPPREVVRVTFTMQSHLE
jgi:hypothetical protein